MLGNCYHCQIHPTRHDTNLSWPSMQHQRSDRFVILGARVSRYCRVGKVDVVAVVVVVVVVAVVVVVEEEDFFVDHCLVGVVVHHDDFVVDHCCCYLVDWPC